MITHKCYKDGKFLFDYKAHISLNVGDYIQLTPEELENITLPSNEWFVVRRFFKEGQVELQLEPYPRPQFSS